MSSPGNTYFSVKNLHLIISVLGIVPIALVYGVYPKTILPMLFDFKVESIDLTNIFRATMGLYLGMCMIWVMGIIKPKLWFAATITSIAFMGGLALGRLISVVVDGVPSIYFIVGLAIEAILAIWGILNLKKYRSNTV